MRLPISVRMGDVLQIRVAAGEPARDGGRLVEAGMHATGAGQNALRERLEIGAQEFLQLAIVQYHRGQFVHGGEFLQHVGVGAGAALGSLDDGELELFKQHGRKLLGRVGVEQPAGGGNDAVAEVVGVFAQLGFHLPQHLHVHGNAGAFHLGQHGHEGHFQLLQQVGKPLGGELLLQNVGQAEGQVGVLAGVRGHHVNGHGVHGDLVFAPADEVSNGDAAAIEELCGQAVELETRPGGVQHVGGNHGVKHRPANGQAGVGENDVIVLEIVADLLHLLAGQDWPQHAANVNQVQHGRTQRPFDGNVHRGLGFPRQRHSHHLGPHGIDAGGFGVHGLAGYACEFAAKFFQFLHRVDAAVVAVGGGFHVNGRFGGGGGSTRFR